MYEVYYELLNGMWSLVKKVPVPCYGTWYQVVLAILYWEHRHASLEINFPSLQFYRTKY
jgi:hypothetical protein